MSRIILGMADVGCLENENIYKEAYESVGAYRQEKTDRLKAVKDKQRCVGAGVLLNGLLQMWYDGKATDSHMKPLLNFLDLTEIMTHYHKELNYDITTVANGKPVFVNCEGLHFNISHSGKYVVCVIADCPVGVDIDGDRAVRERVAERYFSKEECQWIAKDTLRREGRFFVLWTAKEAYAKLTGEGIAMVIGQAHFKVKDGQELSELKSQSMEIQSVKLELCRDSGAEADVTFFQYIFEDCYCITLASRPVLI